MLAHTRYPISDTRGRRPSRKYQVSNIKYQAAGFTLVEMAVIMAIIGIMTLLVAFAFPAVRTNQALLQAQQTFQTELRSAQQQALNELRAEECLAAAGEEEDADLHCSDIGVALVGRNLIIFADTSEADENRKDDDDYILREIELPAAASVDQSFLFQATPPNVYLFSDGTVVPPQGKIAVSFVSNDQVRNLQVGPFGQIEVTNE